MNIDSIRYLKVVAAVRYWEDATVDGVEDADGTLIPFRIGALWCPRIHLEEGRIMEWPAGKTASIHYKVCDAGTYRLECDVGWSKAEWRGDYVPNEFLCHGDNGYGDYIIMDIGPDGKIANYVRPKIRSEQWKPL